MSTCEINGDEQFMRTCEINGDEQFMSTCVDGLLFILQTIDTLYITVLLDELIRELLYQENTVVNHNL